MHQTELMHLLLVDVFIIVIIVAKLPISGFHHSEFWMR